jgi:hypothetical protein
MIPPFLLFPIFDCRLPIENQIGNWKSAIGNELISTVRQHRHHAIVIRLGHEHIDIQVTLSLIGLLRQYVPRMRMATFDLPRGGQAHTLRRTFVCLKFWHELIPSRISNWQLAIVNWQ